MSPREFLHNFVSTDLSLYHGESKQFFTYRLLTLIELIHNSKPPLRIFFRDDELSYFPELDAVLTMFDDIDHEQD